MGANKKDLWLFNINTMNLPSSKACSVIRRYYESCRRSQYTPLHINYDWSSRISIMFIDLPRSRPVLYIFYVSVQDWYLTPSKVLPKIRKALKVYRKCSVPNQDAFLAIVAKRATGGARRLAASAGVPIMSVDAAKEAIKNYFRKRYVSLIDSLRGKRIFGELVFLAAMLQQLALEYGATDIPILFRDPYEAVIAFERGLIIPRDIGPPTSW